MSYNPADIQFTTSQGEILEPGIHFDISMDDYKQMKALSRSGIKDLLISPLTFWTNSAFNPNQEREDSEFTELGEAYHTRILEGRQAFLDRYAPEATFPKGALGSSDELKDRLKELGLKMGTTNLERAKMIRAEELKLQESQPDVPLTPLKALIELEHLDAPENKGKVFLPAVKMQRIELAAQAIEANPELKEFMEGGKPEVTILWRDPATGVPMKARCDWLVMDQAWLELKSFTNINGMELVRAVASAMANRKYGLQAYTNLRGLEELGHPVKKAMFLFQETGRVPNVVARRFNRNGLDHNENLYWMRAAIDYETGVHAFAENYSIYGEAPWNPPVEIGDFQDEDFPAWAR